ncbi:uncharacterized protein MAM_07767 [Metarhizium album ARSEF 1941]|uniref:Uncharacterized protein n=1 Tax=Metarhizium album (strain ARSEF 1941) TaxID=1081103 RepID=A0A0B2WK99_METAS|nr:uncharacterized protein MAM_07767 [Metarhizium album ARSEF 1941]KHN94338.1 hypothetical protein MAM_07767 [Metarhizium album ARSEF 1941]
MNYPPGTPAHAILPVNVQSTSKQPVADKALHEATCKNNGSTQQPRETTAGQDIQKNHKRPYTARASFLLPRRSSTTSKDKQRSRRPDMDLHHDPSSAGMTGQSSASSNRHHHPPTVSAAGYSSSPFAAWRRGSTSVSPGTESAPLTAADAVVGLLAASCQAQCDLDELNTSPMGGTAPLTRLLAKVKSFKTTAQLLHKFLRRVEAGTLAHRDRPALVDLDVLVTVLTASILTVSELESRLDALLVQANELGLGIDEVVPHCSKSLAKDANRIAMVDFILTQLLNLLQVSSHQDAARHQAQAALAVMDMLQADANLASRMRQLQDTANGLQLVSQERRAQTASRSPPSYSLPASRGNDELPSYDQALDDDSVTIQPRDWSVYSGLNLGDISTLSRISLPLILGEIKDAYYYTQQYAQSVREGLIALEQGRSPHKSKSLARVLGIREGSSREHNSRPSDHGGLTHRLALMVARGNLLAPSH